MEKIISKLSEIKPNQKNVFVENVKVIETKLIKASNGSDLCFGKIIDDSITEPINITAWDNASKFLDGAKVIDLENVYCKEYNHAKEITTGKWGRIKVIKKEDKDEKRTN